MTQMDDHHLHQHQRLSTVSHQILGRKTLFFSARKGLVRVQNTITTSEHKVILQLQRFYF